MAVVNGHNYAEQFAYPPEKIAPSKVNNEIGAISEEYAFVANIFAIGDEILGPKLPEGAKILDAYVKCGLVGTAGIFNLGTKAGLDRAGNALAEDDNSLVDQVDAGNALDVLERADQDSALIGTIVGKGGLQTFLTCTEASTAALGVKIEYVVTYIKP